MNTQATTNLASNTKWRWVPLLVNGLLLFVEALLFFAVVSFVFFGIFQLAFSGSSPDQTRTAKVMKILNDDWKVSILVLFVMFYRPIRRFVGNLREGLGFKSSEPTASVPADVPPSQQSGA